MCDMNAMPMGKTFAAMWILMMAVMMLPVLVPMLKHYREAIRERSASRRAILTAIVSAGYFLVWTAASVPVVAAARALAYVGMRQPLLGRFTPLAACAVVIAAGAWQFTAAKARQLVCCRERPEDGLPSDVRTAWRHGLRLGIRCVCCCANLTAILLAVGVMDLVPMALVTAAISAERLAPAGEHAARAIGVVAVVAGLMLAAG